MTSIRYNRYTKVISRNPWSGLADHTLKSTVLKHSDSFTYVPPTSVETAFYPHSVFAPLLA